MKTNFLLAVICLLPAGAAFAQGATANKKSAQLIRDEALKQETVLDSIDYLKDNLVYAETPADERSLLHFTGTLQEQLGLYTDASTSYAKAAGIAAKDADNMARVSTEQLVLDAVRASLCAGNWENADSYLASAVRDSKDEGIQATLRLYAVWSDLCKATGGPKEGISDSVELLKAYRVMKSMYSVKPQVLLTLWRLTTNDEYAQELKREFPQTPEASIVEGKTRIMSVPFWYFVPTEPQSASDHAVVSASTPPKESAPTPKPPVTESTPSASAPKAAAAPKTTAPVESPAPVVKPASPKPPTPTAKAQPAPTSKPASAEVAVQAKRPGKKQQLGLFRIKANADECVRMAQNAGFDAYCYAETRASGTSYFVVAVDEDAEGSVGKRLKAQGIDCYAIE